MYLVSAGFSVTSFRLTLTFNNVIRVTGSILGFNLVAHTTSARYGWQATFGVFGKILVCRMVLISAGPDTVRVRYNASPAVIVDGQGRLFGAGEYRLTLTP